MPFLGTLVVRLSDKLLLFKSQTDETVSPTIWGELITRCTAPNFRTSSFLADDEKRFGFHILSDDEIAFTLLSDESTTRRSAHIALDDISKLFKKMFVESPSKLSSNACDVFQQPLLQLLARHAKPDTDEKVRQVKRTVEEVKGLALDNVEKVLARGQQIEEIISATDDLQSQAQGFQRNSRALRNQMWWNNAKTKIFIIGGVLAFLLIVYFIFCGGISCS
jgi:vesicle-associated membrane protein 7